MRHSYCLYFLCVGISRIKDSYLLLFCLANILKLILYFFYLQRMKAVKCPTDELSLTNKAIVNDIDFDDSTKYVSSVFFFLILFFT